MELNRLKIKFSLSTNIFIGLVLGISCGLFFGDMCSGLEIVGQGFIKLLQMTILPYIVVSLVLGIGSLTYRDAKLLALKGGLLLLVFWTVGLLMVLSIPFAFPSWKSGSFFSTSIVEPIKDIDYLGLYIPSNPFNAMANNIIPAVVFFSLCVGVSMIGIKNKEPFLKDLSVLSQALTRITHVIVNLTPLGVFAISAGAAGTMTIGQFERLQVYFICYILASILMTFVVIPFIGTAITPFKYRDIVGASKDALITGFTTGNLFIVLPVVEKNIKELFERYNKNNEETQALIDIITPVYFNFPDTGKLLSLIFILFGAWFAGTPMPYSRYPDFTMTGFFTFFGGADIAIPFLLRTFQIPSDLFHLYIVAGILNGRFSTLLAVMDLFVFSLLCTSALIGLVELKLRKIIFYASLAAAAVICALVGTKISLNNLLKPSKKESEFLVSMKVETQCKAKVLLTLPSAKTVEEENKKYKNMSVLGKIRKRGFLRVGYSPDALPFAFFNKKDQLVGYDIATAYRLAKDLNCDLQFVPFRNSHIIDDLNKGYYDIAMSGVTVTMSRLENADFTKPYMELTLALVVLDYKKDDYNSQKELLKMKHLKIAVLKYNVHTDLLKKYLPNAKIIKIDRREDFFTKNTGADALLISAEEGAAWTLVYPEYGIAVPKPLLLKMNAAYPLPKGDLEFANFMNQWLEMQKANGFPKKQYNYWILGKEQKKKEPRWSIIRNVLGWTK